MNDNYPHVIPMLSYEDGVVAMDWLCKAFGFKQRIKMLDDNGRLAHGELIMGDGIIMLASPTPNYQNPKHHRRGCKVAQQ